MNVLFEAAKEVCEFMAVRKWEFCIIGGLAVQRWGEPRTTLDEKHIVAHLSELCELKESPEILKRAVHLLQEKS